MSMEITESRPHRTAQPELNASIEAAELLLFCRDLRGTVVDAVVAASGRALRAHAELDLVARRIGTGVGVAVDTESGLSVPVVRNAADGLLPDVRAEVASLVVAARNGALSADDIGGAAVTVCECTLDAASVVSEARTDIVLEVDWSGGDSLGLALYSTVDDSEAGRARARRFFATLVRLLEHPYRLLD